MIQVMTAAITTMADRNIMPAAPLPVRSFSAPKMKGPTNPPRLPTELITAMEIAAVERVRNRDGTAQNGDLKAYSPMIATLKRPMAMTGLLTRLTAPGRVAKVAQGIKRLGLPPIARKYFELHAVLDVKHAEDWIDNCLRPLVEEDPSRVRFLAEGALMRLACGERCFDAYRGHLWSNPALRFAAE